MNRVAKDTFAKLCADVSSGNRIPDFYFSFLPHPQLEHLLSLAATSGNRIFDAQVKEVVRKSAAQNSVEPERQQREIEKQKPKKKIKKRGKVFTRISLKEKGIVRERNKGFGGRAGGVVSRY